MSDYGGSEVRVVRPPTIEVERACLIQEVNLASVDLRYRNCVSTTITNGVGGKKKKGKAKEKQLD